MASNSLRKVQRTQKLGQDRLTTLLDKQGNENHDEDKIIQRIENSTPSSEQRTIIHTHAHAHLYHLPRVIISGGYS